MEKKFKNNLFVKGSQSLLKAFAEELDKLGYLPKYQEGASVHPKSFSDDINSLFIEKSGTYYGQSFRNNQYRDYVFSTLPNEWNYALKIASEIEEAVPEYVECIKKDSGILVGKIYKVSKKCKWEFSDSDGCNDIYYLGEDGRPYYTSYFKPSTKESYEAQENTPKYKVGDFYSDKYSNDLRYIYAIENGEYKFYCIDGQKRSNTIAHVDNYSESSYRKVSDEEALKILKEHYAKQGIVEGARVTWGKQQVNHTITGFDLIKNRPCNSHKDAGNSQLSIIINGCHGVDTITPTIENFKVLPKEVKVASYEVKIQKGPIGTEKLIKIGCQTYTYHSLITIRDLIISGHNGAYSFAYFNLSGVGTIKVTVDELNQAIELFNK